MGCWSGIQLMTQHLGYSNGNLTTSKRASLGTAVTHLPPWIQPVSRPSSLLQLTSRLAVMQQMLAMKAAQKQAEPVASHVTPLLIDWCADHMGREEVQGVV